MTNEGEKSHELHKMYLSVIPVFTFAESGRFWVLCGIISSFIAIGEL